ncbi:MAG: hypothetical protein CME19_18480 [Gemmatimonadetes bacterium]|nr:hypothetical protein [Gemmatimonadota bacterium]
MTVIALCETLGKAVHLWAEMSSVNGVACRFLVCDNRSKPLQAVVQHLKDILRLPLRGKIFCLAGLLRGTVSLKFAHLHDPRTIDLLRKYDADIALHGMNVIYRRSILDCFKMGVLNAHIGLLPRYRGRSVMEWSILEGAATGISVFFLDEGIDTGQHIVTRAQIDVSRYASTVAAKDFLLSLDARSYRDAILALTSSDYVPGSQTLEEGKRYYPMSRLLTGVVDRHLYSLSDGDTMRD